MKFQIKHRSHQRLRVHMCQKNMSFEQADCLLYYLHAYKNVTFVKVYERTADAVISYVGEEADILKLLSDFSYDTVEVPEVVLENSGRALNQKYQEKLIGKVAFHYLRKWLLPAPVRLAYNTVNALKYGKEGISCLAKGKVEVPVLDATAIWVSMLRGESDVAGSIMFMLGIGELLEEWTHKKSVDDLARSLSLNVGNVWKKVGEQQILAKTSEISLEDDIVVHMGNVIPFDGVIIDGEAMVNQASLTGESVAVRKIEGGYVYAGTVVEEGELTIRVKAVGGNSRFEKIVTMIEESEKLKSSVESKAAHLADKLVPYSLLGTGLTWLVTKNASKALAILMVDYSCALKLAMPISVLSAIREASLYNVTVKGGKFLEAIAEADTVVLDKTGTITKAQPTVHEVISFDGQDPDELLRIAACLEEHFPHSMAKAVVSACEAKGLRHEEMHSKVEYIVAHGVVSTISEKRVIIGSAHFAFEDEKVVIPDNKRDVFEQLPPEYSYLYMAIDGKLAAVLSIEDPLREEAQAVITSLRKAGIGKIVMMTGDSERTAAAVAREVGVDAYFSEVLPEDKARFVEEEKKQGRRVIMIGDGINDSPALSAADVGIAIHDGAEIAREIADITIGADNLYQIVTLKLLSDALMHRIRHNYRTIVGFNSLLIVLGVAGILQPTTTALLHNTSTLMIGLKSMNNLLS
ncbi:ATPase, P-type (transporting), HAD superfamily, subfamily IC/heavy metal translocating P-type ATPase [Lachnospiraceae bacterium XBB1006]|nr:ATPase, P-type (transporting), HAD superfamily, subfamily IC/heavy metal translocating P-type ATPase [Lachnospiraceae bacterium XBB1006]